MTEVKTKSKIARFTTPPFAISYPHLFVATKMEDQPNSKLTFSCRAIWRDKLFDEGSKKLWIAMNNEIVRVICDHKWPKGVKIAKPEGKTSAERRLAAEAKLLKAIPAAKMALRNGGDEFPDDKAYGPDSWFANMRSESRPGVVDYSKNRIHPDEGNGDEIYPGAICRATITIFAYPNAKDYGGRGYSFGLGNIQKLKDGPRLDSRVAAEDDFDEDVDSAFLDTADESGGETADEDFE